MARRQTEIPGTERTDVPPALLEAGGTWLDARREKRIKAEKAKEARLGVLALMQANKFTTFKVLDEETGEYLTLEIDVEPKLRTKKSGEAEPEPIGDGVPSGGDDEPGVHPGLVRQAEASAMANGVSETPEGDVVPPDVAAPKAKAKKRKAQ